MVFHQLQVRLENHRVIACLPSGDVAEVGLEFASALISDARSRDLY